MSFADEIRSQIEQKTVRADVEAMVPDRAEIERSTIAEFEKVIESVKQRIMNEAKSGSFDLKRRNNVIKGEIGCCSDISSFMQGCGIEGGVRKGKSGGGFINDPMIQQIIVFKVFYPDIFQRAFRGAVDRLQQDGIKASCFELVITFNKTSSDKLAIPLERLTVRYTQKIWVDAHVATDDLRTCNLRLKCAYKFRF